MLDTLNLLRANGAHRLKDTSGMSSQAAVAAAMTRDIARQSAPVIELGSGSGVVTQALLERGIPEGRLVLVDKDSDAVRSLRLRFPEADIYCSDASALRAIEVYDWDAPGAVVSRLPMTFMGRRKIYAILTGAFRHLRDDGAFYQLSHSGVCPVPASILRRLDLEAKSIGWTWNGLRPVRIYRITRAH